MSGLKTPEARLHAHNPSMQEQRLDLINTLNEVTEGKIFVEVRLHQRVGVLLSAGVSGPEA